MASSPFRVGRIPACLGQQALPPRLSPRTQAGPLYPPRLPMQMRPPTGLLPHCAAADIPPQQIRILSGAWVLFFFSFFPNLSPDYLQTAPLQGATRDCAESSEQV